MQQFVQSCHLLSGKMPNVSAANVHDLPDKDLQETPFVTACSNIDYLRSGNIKFNDKSLTLSDQETS
ncbi:MAG: hypothetical protein ACI8ZB_003289 [Desulforhopalus sp.]|jgi:hypothetical protein